MFAPDPIDIHLGKAVRRRRRIMDLTQAQLAERVGVRFQQVGKYETGANRMSAAVLWRIAEALETTVGEFFAGLPEMRRAA